jgi:hypothetical protein
VDLRPEMNELAARVLWAEASPIAYI